MSAYRWQEGECSEGAWTIVHRWPGNPKTRLVLAENTVTGERVTRRWHPAPARVPGAEPAYMATVRAVKRRQAAERRGLRPDGTDPLEGKRAGLNDGSIRRLIWPADEPCPVGVGDTFGLRSGQLTITRITEKPRLVDRPARWEAEFTLQRPDRPRLLRRTPPVDPPEHDELDRYGQVPPPTATDVERGRLDGSYTTSPHLAVPGDGGEGVPDDWEDQGKEKREEMRIESRKTVETERQIQAAKSRLNRLLRGLDSAGQKAMLEELTRLCEQAEAGDIGQLRDAA